MIFCIQPALWLRGVIAVSEPVRKKLNEKLSNRIEDKIVVIPNCINVDLMKNTSIDRNVEKSLLFLPEQGFCAIAADWTGIRQKLPGL